MARTCAVRRVELRRRGASELYVLLTARHLDIFVSRKANLMRNLSSVYEVCSNSTRIGIVVFVFATRIDVFVHVLATRDTSCKWLRLLSWLQ